MSFGLIVRQKLLKHSALQPELQPDKWKTKTLLYCHTWPRDITTQHNAVLLQAAVVVGLDKV